MTIQPDSHRSLRLLTRWLTAALAACACTSLIACSGFKKDAPKTQPRYAQLPLRDVPPYLKDSILQRADVVGTEPELVAGYGLVGRLRDTGDSTAPTAIRDFMVKEMVKHGFGSSLQPNGKGIEPTEILHNPSFAIVHVDGLIPPGARKGQWFDVQVSALQDNHTSSLAHGELFQTDLGLHGGIEPGGNIDVLARCQGPIFVNPVYSVARGGATGAGSTAAANASLRYGLVMYGGRIMTDRYLVLRLRQPQRSLSRAIEGCVRDRFQDRSVASAQDEGIIHLFVPEAYHGDWEHFSQVVRHLFINVNVPLKAAELAREAVKPDAPLLDISYCWEALGPGAIPAIQPLMIDQSPDVTFAAARAAALLGDSSAQNLLGQMALDSNHPFQVSAIQTLGQCPASPVIGLMLRKVLNLDSSQPRIEAYKILARNEDNAIFTRTVPQQADEQKFFLDIVPSEGPPLIYATRQGLPRIAILGRRAALNLPITFTALNDTLSISTPNDNNKVVNIFYRGADAATPITVVSRPDVAEIVARLGGEGPPGEARFDFTYADVVGMLQALSDSHRLSAIARAGRVSVAFVMQEAAKLQDDISSAPTIPERTRPQSSDGADSSPTIGQPPAGQGAAIHDAQGAAVGGSVNPSPAADARN